MIDLKELMAERSAAPPAPGGERLRQVQHRIVKRRRRRITTGVLGVALAVLSLGYLIQPANRAMPDPAATPTPRVIHGFPEYQFGHRVIAAAEGTIAGRVVSAEFTPTTAEFAIRLDCRNLSGPESLYGDLMFNGILWIETGPCGTFFGNTQLLEQRGIPAGTPITVTYRLTRAATALGEPAALPQDGQIGLAIQVPVAFSEWPFPPAPAKLQELGEVVPWCGAPSNGRAYTISSDPADPLRTVEATVIWDRYNMSWLTSQTPGIFTIAVNGIEAGTLTVWDYQANLGSIETHDHVFGSDPPAPGDQVVVTVTPRHVTGLWQVTTMVNPSDGTMCVLHRDQAVQVEAGN